MNKWRSLVRHLLNYRKGGLGKVLYQTVRGFTLIELLVVVGIVGLISSVITTSLSSSRDKARDAQRIHDLNTLRTALELYYNDNGQYPTNAGKIGEGDSLDTELDRYLSSVPFDPLGPGNSDYFYYYDPVHICNDAEPESESTVVYAKTMEESKNAQYTETCNDKGAGATNPTVDTRVVFIITSSMLAGESGGVSTEPILTTDSAVATGPFTADVSGAITDNGGEVVTERGFAYGLNIDPDIISDTKVIVGSGVGSFNTTLSGLTESTPYYVRAYATNSVGTSYGSSLPFTTGASLSAGTLLFSQEGFLDNDLLGNSVSSAGDFDGDGIDDIIIGAFGSTRNSKKGKIYVYSGGSTNTLLFSAEGEGIDHEFGFSVSSAGDYNGDGYDDVIVGADYYNGTLALQGKIYIYSGLDNSLLFSKEGENGRDNFGISVSNAGDYNNDGFDDVVVGATGYDGSSGSNTGKIYIYSGKDNSLIFSAEGEKRLARHGISVSSIGDYNNDSYDDVIIGASKWDCPAAVYYCGRIYIYSGMDNSIIFSKEGEAKNDYFGSSVSSAGDYNGDGFVDVVVGATGYNGSSGIDTGKIYIYSGLDDSLLFSEEGQAMDDELGESVSSAGDFNNDGFDDVIVGAYLYDGANGADSGKIYIYSGLDNSLLFSKEGENGGDFFGISVSSIGDQNGDGYDDVIVGAEKYDGVGGANSGKVYIYSGGS